VTSGVEASLPDQRRHQFRFMFPFDFPIKANDRNSLLNGIGNEALHLLGEMQRISGPFVV
jgi:hypothetical protein